MKHPFLDVASIVTLAVTVVLFVMALLEKGITQEASLEAGVFLVSAKLVIGLYELRLSHREIQMSLSAIQARLDNQKQ